jgi:hypothetical protein
LILWVDDSSSEFELMSHTVFKDKNAIFIERKNSDGNSKSGHRGVSAVS